LLYAAAAIALSAAAGCSSANAGSPGRSSPEAPSTASPEARSAAAHALPVSEADVRFMSGMIPHHAQAVLIAGWAPSHGARSDIRILAERIVVAQQDEIALVQNWLRDNGQSVPEADATHARMMHDGVAHDMLMPGMLTAEELAQLDRARGPEFDRLFLAFMIRHHDGALTMVDQLFESYGAAQDEMVFRFASDVYADQTTEIHHMQNMLDALTSGGRRP
jgi:uncharacterized protein (DUF305 family)